MDMPNESETGCCTKFDPTPWDEKEHIFKDKLFVKDHVKSFMHVPINFSKVITRCMEKISDAKAFPQSPFMISDEKSFWGSDLYIEVSKDVPFAEMASISGTFLSKAFEGPYTDTRKWIKKMKKFVESKGRPISKMYFFYTTCPKCAKHYGKNYVVIFAKTD